MCDKDHYIALEHRVDDLEMRVNTMHDEMRGGFNAVNANIETLSRQITNMDKRIVEEKQKWGDVTRECVRWTVRSLLAIVVYAAGINITKSIIALWN